MADFSTHSMLIISYGMDRPSARVIYYKEGGGIIFLLLWLVARDEVGGP